MKEAGRSATYEREFVTQVCKAAGITGQSGVERVLDAVSSRLDDGQAEYGPSSFLSKPLAPEMSEEAIDLTAWGVLWAQQLSKLEQEGKLDPRDGQHIRLLIIEAAGYAVRAYDAIENARELFRDRASDSELVPLVGYRHFYEE